MKLCGVVFNAEDSIIIEEKSLPLPIIENSSKDVINESFKDFSDLPISPAVIKAIQELGYTEPTPIQAETIPFLLGEPTDFLGLAATGTGKTAAFAIPLLNRIDPDMKRVQALVLCPTRELAIQVAEQISLLGKHLGVKALPIYGGAGYGDQIAGLRRGANVVVGTPGRVVDHLEKGTLQLDSLSVLVLDEADEMISMGFKEDLTTILETPPEGATNTWLFSATMSPDVRHVADDYLKNPKMVQKNRTEMIPTNLEQIYYATSESNKPEVLCKLIDAAPDFYGIVFCQTKVLVMDLMQYLSERGYKVDCLHGDKDQNARERTMQAFREKRVSMLVCTDVAARGLDVKDISHVINYSIPRELDSYVHRIGRTARSGKTGYALSLVTPSHRALIGRIERVTKSRMKEGKIPTRKEIGVKKIGELLTRFQAQNDFSRATSLLSDEWKLAIAEMDREELAGRFLCLSFPEIFTITEKTEARAPKPQKNFDPRGGRFSRGRDSDDAAPRGEIRRERSDRGSDERPFIQSKFKGRKFDQPRSSDRFEGKREERRGDSDRWAPKPWGKPRSEPRSEARVEPREDSRGGDRRFASEKPYRAKTFGSKPFGKKPESARRY